MLRLPHYLENVVAMHSCFYQQKRSRRHGLPRLAITILSGLGICVIMGMACAIPLIIWHFSAQDWNFEIFCLNIGQSAWAEFLELMQYLSDTVVLCTKSKTSGCKATHRIVDARRSRANYPSTIHHVRSSVLVLTQCTILCSLFWTLCKVQSMCECQKFKAKISKYTQKHTC